MAARTAGGPGIPGRIGLGVANARRDEPRGRRQRRADRPDRGRPGGHTHAVRAVGWNLGERSARLGALARRAQRAAGPRGVLLLLFFLLTLVDLAIYRPALRGGLIGDDHLYITNNAYTSRLSAENAVAIVTPGGPAMLQAINYAPVHLFATALERQLFGDDPFGYHVVNVVLHALCSVLLVALFRGSRIPLRAALLGGILFNLHPANVEAVAAINQLRSTGALALALGSLICFRRHPGAATLLFALGLLTKPSAAAVLPMAAAFRFSWWRQGSREAPHWGWLVGWVSIFALYAVPQFQAFAFGGEVEVAEFANPWVHLRSMAAGGVRYLLMAATSYGTSAYQEPPPVLSPLDPWWLASIPLAMALAWRTLGTLRRGREEAAYWLGAAAAFAPVSNLFPFFYALADRYLYFILPGLIGGVLLWGAEMRQRWASRRSPAVFSRAPARAVAIGAIVLAVFFGLRSEQRAFLWSHADLLLLDAARQYPQGTSAHYLRAVRFANDGDADAAVSALREAEKRNLSFTTSLSVDPKLRRIWHEPVFIQFVRDIAAKRIEYGRRHGKSTQPWLRSMAQSHAVLGEYDEAVVLLERAIRMGGPLFPALLSDLEQIRAAQRRARREPSGP